MSSRRRPRVAGLRGRPGITSQPWSPVPEHLRRDMQRDVLVDMGWGRLVFGQTFHDLTGILDVLRSEETGERDICIYPPDPQVLVGLAPTELFIDPSYTLRLPLHRYRRQTTPPRGLLVRTVGAREELLEANRICASVGMVTGDVDVLWANQRTRTFTYLVAQDTTTGEIVGTVTGVDHVLAFDDPDGGSSLWALAVDPQSRIPGVGEALTRTLAQRYQARGRSWMDLSVLASNTSALALYEKLGFVRTASVCVKRKNPINEPLFAPRPDSIDDLNPYARIIAEEALRRGIRVEVTDGRWGEMRLTHGGRQVLTRESLSELTSAVAMSRCDDKRVTRRLLQRAGVPVARGHEVVAGAVGEAEEAFLREMGDVVVKPARGEQGKGITVGVSGVEELREAVAAAHALCPDVLLEELVPGEDLRVLVIDDEVVAAAVRRPATVVGNGRDTIETLVAAQSRRRERATGGESSIPLDATTEAVVRAAGHAMDDVLPRGEHLQVRRTANLHTGGTIEDCTDDLSPAVRDAALRSARVIGIPVTGVDFLVPDVGADDGFVFVEANERPGLANHEPRPTAQRFVDLLFPGTAQPGRSATMPG
ncbi:N-acetylglutaminylglutamine synthetase [Aquipuribacter nitratireducens]|uniref:N-acetylglutaminylglutamine synthetase n=1 Tax=Aquipuribacter nitratireducens TaxID=650104 RepID=A0ABW0GIG7_9MICO